MEEGKIFTEKAINIGTFLGGPIVGGYMLSENFKVLKEDDYSRRVLFATIIFFFVFFELLFMIPQPVAQKIPDAFFPLIYGGIGYWIYKSFQKKRIDEFIKAGGLKQSGLKITGITLFGMIITLAYILFRVSYMAPFEGEVMEFGASKHRIYYDQSINTKDVQIVGDALIQFGYFQSDLQQAVNLVKTADEYYLYINVIQKWWDNKDIIESLQSLEEAINAMNLEHHLKIRMYDETFSGRKEKLLPDK